MGGEDVLMYVGIKTNAWTLIPEIVEVNFKLKRYGEDSKYLAGTTWLSVTKGAITGYEEMEIKPVLEKDGKRSFVCWVACGGTLNKYHRLEIPMSQILQYLLDEGYIEITREYGYIKDIKWIKEVNLEV